jgi:TrmH family RNA methyltransferase
VIRTIVGRQNASIKLARKLQRKKYRTERGLCVAEGFDLLASGVAHGLVPREVLVREGLESRVSELLGPSVSEVNVGVCTQSLIEECSSLGGAADVLALFPLPVASLADVDMGEGLTLYVHEVGDPGNVGTLVRSAAAFGAGGVLLSPRTADGCSPKALRAGMGAQFVVPVVPEVSFDDVQRKMAADVRRGESAPEVLVAEAKAGDDPREVVQRAQGAGGVLLVLGSERGSLPDMSQATTAVTIPQQALDSLNVAMAGTILLYEISRVRAAGRGGSEGVGDARPTSKA